VGRRGVRLEDEGKWVFNRLAGAYTHRPGYPDALVERLAALAGGAGAAVADLGAGTGHLALPLARRGLRVSAVEPARAMLEALARRAAEEGLRVQAVHGSAELTGLASGAFGLVLWADAAHWVDPELAGREAVRLVQASGVCAVVEAELGHTPFLDALRELIADANPRSRRPPRPSVTAQLLALSRPGADPVVERFEHEVTLGDDALEGTLRSLSYVGPALAPERVDALVGAARELSRRLGGAVWRRHLTLTWAGAEPARTHRTDGTP